MSNTDLNASKVRKSTLTPDSNSFSSNENEDVVVQKVGPDRLGHLKWARDYRNGDYKKVKSFIESQTKKLDSESRYLTEEGAGRFLKNLGGEFAKGLYNRTIGSLPFIPHRHSYLKLAAQLKKEILKHFDQDFDQEKTILKDFSDKERDSLKEEWETTKRQEFKEACNKLLSLVEKMCAKAEKRAWTRHDPWFPKKEDSQNVSALKRGVKRVLHFLSVLCRRIAYFAPADKRRYNDLLKLKETLELGLTLLENSYARKALSPKDRAALLAYGDIKESIVHHRALNQKAIEELKTHLKGKEIPKAKRQELQGKLDLLKKENAALAGFLLNLNKDVKNHENDKGLYGAKRSVLQKLVLLGERGLALKKEQEDVLSPLGPEHHQRNEDLYNFLREKLESHFNQTTFLTPHQRDLLKFEAAFAHFFPKEQKLHREAQKEKYEKEMGEFLKKDDINPTAVKWDNFSTPKAFVNARLGELTQKAQELSKAIEKQRGKIEAHQRQIEAYQERIMESQRNLENATEEQKPKLLSYIKRLKKLKSVEEASVKAVKESVENLQTQLKEIMSKRNLIETEAAEFALALILKDPEDKKRFEAALKKKLTQLSALHIHFPVEEVTFSVLRDFVPRSAKATGIALRLTRMTSGKRDSFLESQTVEQLEGLSKLLSYFRNEIPESDKKGLIELVWTGKKEEEPSVEEVTGVAQEILFQIPLQKLRVRLEDYKHPPLIDKKSLKELQEEFRKEHGKISSKGLWALTGTTFVPPKEVNLEGEELSKFFAPISKCFAPLYFRLSEPYLTPILRLTQLPEKEYNSLKSLKLGTFPSYQDLKDVENEMCKSLGDMLDAMNCEFENSLLAKAPDYAKKNENFYKKQLNERKKYNYSLLTSRFFLSADMNLFYELWKIPAEQREEVLRGRPPLDLERVQNALRRLSMLNFNLVFKEQAKELLSIKEDKLLPNIKDVESILKEVEKIKTGNQNPVVKAPQQLVGNNSDTKLDDNSDNNSDDNVIQNLAPELLGWGLSTLESSKENIDKNGVHEIDDYLNIEENLKKN